jgi:hypothetical protein
MNIRRLAPWFASVAGALLVLAIGSLSSTRPHPARPEVLALLSELEAECHPESMWNNYVWSTNAPPTEKHRRLILERLHELRGAAAPEAGRMLNEHRNDEFGEMLMVLAAALGDRTMITPAAKLMAYSEYPAVRLSAARELRTLRDPQTLEWFEYTALHDDRCVRNDGCGRTVELYYPVRAEAELALREMLAPIADAGSMH